MVVSKNGSARTDACGENARLSRFVPLKSAGGTHQRRRVGRTEIPGRTQGQRAMGRYLLLWLIGVPLPILLIIWLLGGLH
jgi:hypothetical protein